MTENKVRLTNGQHWTAQQFIDHYFAPTASGTPTPVAGRPSPVDVDRSWYMDEGPGRYYHPGMFPIVNQIVRNRKLAAGTHDLETLANRKKDLSARIFHYTTDPSSADYPLRALVFGDESAVISGKVEVNPYGSKIFKQIEIRPWDTNFDFKHNTWWNVPLEAAREIARRRFDPDNQGFSYDIQYRGPGPNRGTGRLYDSFTDVQLNAALRNPGNAPPGLLTSVTGKPPLQYASEHRQYLDQVSGLAAPLPQGGGAPVTSGGNSLPHLSRRYGYSPASAPGPGVPVGAPMLTGSSNDPGGLAEWFTTMAGIDPQNPMQPSSPPLDDDLRGFYRDDAFQPWTLQRRR